MVGQIIKMLVLSLESARKQSLFLPWCVKLRIRTYGVKLVIYTKRNPGLTGSGCAICGPLLVKLVFVLL